MIGEPALPAVAGLGIEPVDEIDDVVEPAAGAGTDAASGNGDRKMRLAGAGPALEGNSLLLPTATMRPSWMISAPSRIIRRLGSTVTR